MFLSRFFSFLWLLSFLRLSTGPFWPPPGPRQGQGPVVDRVFPFHPLHAHALSLDPDSESDPAFPGPKSPASGSKKKRDPKVVSRKVKKKEEEESSRMPPTEALDFAEAKRPTYSEVGRLVFCPRH